MSKMWDYPCRKLNSTTKSSATLEFSVRVFWPTLFSQRFTRLSSTSENHLTLLVALEAHRIRIKRLETFLQQKWAPFDLIIICCPMTRVIWIPVKNPRSQRNRGDRGLWSGRPVGGGHARRQIRGSEDDEASSSSLGHWASAKRVKAHSLHSCRVQRNTAISKK